MMGQIAATGGAPLFGSPGTVLPVTEDEAESFAGFGSAGVLAVRVAVFVTVVVPLTVAVIWSVAVALTARAPMFHTPEPAL
jgi:hypothetical protein